MQQKPSDVIKGALEAWGPTLQRTVSQAVIAALRDAGWIIVRHDAIKLAQAHARDERRADNDNRPNGSGIGPY
jgi:hypothetical protein